MADYRLESDFQSLGLGDNRSGNRDYGGYSSPSYQPPSDRPPLPQGWIPIWDQSNQRWFYANEQTGQTQWEAPGYMSGRPSGQYSPGGPPSYGGPGYESHGNMGAPVNPPMQSPSGGYDGDGYDGDGRHEEKKSGKGKILLGAGAGMAVGLAGGALLHHALHDSDSDSASSKSSSDRKEEYEDLPPSERPGWVPQAPPESDHSSSSDSGSDNGEKAELEAREEYLSRQDSGYERYEYERTTVTTYETVQTSQTYQSSYETVSYERSYGNTYEEEERSDDRFDDEDGEPYDDGVHYDADGYEEY